MQRIYFETEGQQEKKGNKQERERERKERENGRAKWLISEESSIGYNQRF